MPWGAAASAAVGVVGGLFGGNKGAASAEHAATIQAAASDRAAVAQIGQQEKIRQDLAPFTNGAMATGDLANYFTFEQRAQPTLDYWEGAVANAIPQGMSQAQLEATPGYQFDLSQGLKSVQSSNAAKGLGVSGAALKGAAKYATGLADNTYQNQYALQQSKFNDTLATAQNVGATLGQRFNMVASPVQTSQNSAAMTASTGLQSTALANNALMAGANAQAAGVIGAANAQTSGINSATNAIGSGYQNYMLTQALQNNNSNAAEGGTWDTPVATDSAWSS